MCDCGKPAVRESQCNSCYMKNYGNEDNGSGNFTTKQLSFIRVLAEETNTQLPNPFVMTKKGASKFIRELVEKRDAQKKARKKTKIVNEVIDEALEITPEEKLQDDIDYGPIPEEKLEANKSNGRAISKIDTQILDALRKEIDASVVNLEASTAEQHKWLSDAVMQNMTSMQNKIARQREVIREYSKEVESIRLKTPQKVVIEIKNNGKVTKTDTAQHKIFPEVLQWIVAGENVLLVGPSGSGKTTLARNIAKTLDRPFYFSGAILQKYELTGYMDATGNYVSSSFRKAFEKGGVFLWDEMDASAPEALVAFGAAIDNKICDFPDNQVQAHPDFVCMASANTYGMGADRMYVGRNQLDAATLNRFAVIEMGYDESLEIAISDPQTDVEWEWIENVVNCRHAVEKLNIRHVISPRASISGIKMIRAGMLQADLENSLIWKGLEESQVRKVKEEAIKHV